jgi:hypothetical protein
MTYIVKFQESDFVDNSIDKSKITNTAAILGGSTPNTFTTNQTISNTLNNTGYYRIPYKTIPSQGGGNYYITGNDGFLEVFETSSLSGIYLPLGSVSVGKIFIIKNNSSKSFNILTQGGDVVKFQGQNYSGTSITGMSNLAGAALAQNVKIIQNVNSSTWVVLNQ